MVLEGWGSRDRTWNDPKRASLARAHLEPEQRQDLRALWSQNTNKLG